MEMTSKERILNSISYDEIDYIPCSFMAFYVLTNKFKELNNEIDEELKMGLDAAVNVGTLGHSFHPDTKYTQWVEKQNGNKYFFRRLDTPAGPLTQKIIQKDNWPTEDFFPIFDDNIITRSEDFFIDPERDLEKLKYLLGEFSNENINRLKSRALEAKKIAKKYNLIQVCGEMCRNIFNEKCFCIISGADTMSWLSGFENIMYLSLTKPEIVTEYVNIISEWNRNQIEIYLDVTDADLIVRRAWYETTEFWTPETYKKIILPNIKKEAEVVHQAGKKYGYIMTSAFMPIIDYILDSGIDVMIGIDPKEGKGTDFNILKKKFAAKKKALWGGISGPLTLENGTNSDTENAVIEALEILGKDGGFILSPVDNVREETENVWGNINKLIDTWKKYRNRF